ncbi:hypothetical protein [Lentibacillus sediminis]|uniref:hypothetical protein n=1 Tax=Lentibacillus sediminis TaxID=1940529 RepID=UPI000C1C6D59|nr:hypothetical protein [Lentibacillus sediminis]
MKHYLKLVNFELGRFIKVYLVLIAITIISQIAGIIVHSNNFVGRANESMTTMEQFAAQNGTLMMSDFMLTLWFLGPIALCIAALIFYCFLIWYRDWFGKNTFVYRLLMLPTARLNILLAKASAVFLMVLGLVSLQLVLLIAEQALLQTIVPDVLRTDMSIAEMGNRTGFLQVLIPESFTGFLSNYGIGFMMVFILFTAILFERSYRWKGILLGAVYAALAVTVFLLPLIIQLILGMNYLYPMEVFLAMLTLGILVTGTSIWLSHYLLNRKVTV